VHARFTDRADASAATEWFEFEIPLADLDLPGQQAQAAVAAEPRFISAAKLAALRHLYKTIGAEIVRLQDELHGSERAAPDRHGAERHNGEPGAAARPVASLPFATRP
jgi:hypothetical protein